MDHREYSSGGAEYFPTGREFSPPPGEHPRPAPEMAPAAVEVDRSGAEYHQTTTSPAPKVKKRRRNISPAMLTTAAVAVAVITVAPLSSVVSPGYSDAPTLTLSAQSREYLDGVMANLSQADNTQLVAMAQDTRLRHLVVEEAADYIDRLIEYEERQEDTRHYWFFDGSPETVVKEGGYHNLFFYSGDGELRSIIDWDSRADTELFFDYTRYSFTESSDTIQTQVNFTRREYREVDVPYQQTQASIHYSDRDDGYHSEFVDYSSGQHQLVELFGKENNYYEVFLSGRSSQWNYYHGGGTSSTAHTEYVVAEGDFTLAEVPPPDPMYAQAYANYLYDGVITVTWTGSSASGASEQVTIPVKNGVAQLPDNVTVEHDTDYSYLQYNGDRSSHHFAYSYSAVSEEEYLTHLAWYILHKGYYHVLSD